MEWIYLLGFLYAVFLIGDIVINTLCLKSITNTFITKISYEVIHTSI